MQANNMLSLTAVAALLCSISVQQIHSLADCYTTEVFSCAGNASAVVNSGTECCDRGYLAYQTQGADVCELCSMNVICYGTSTCQDSGLGLDAMASIDSCCTNTIGGLSYVNSAGNCMTCDPRTPDPTTAAPTTSAPTTMATTTSSPTTMATTTTEELAPLPGDIQVIGSELGGVANVGAIVGGVIGGLVAVAAITTVTVVAIVLVIRARPGP